MRVSVCLWGLVCLMGPSLCDGDPDKAKELHETALRHLLPSQPDPYPFTHNIFNYFTPTTRSDDWDIDTTRFEVLTTHPSKFNYLIPKIKETDQPSLRKRNAFTLLYIAANIYHYQPSYEFLADSILFGKYGHTKNPSKAFKLYLHLSTHFTSPEAQRMTGLLYATGIGIEKSYSKALLYLSFAAVGGDVIASQTLGYYSLSGIATAKSCEDAVWHMRRVSQHVIKTFNSGPPLGLSPPFPPKKVIEKDVYGPGASGKGSPPKQNTAALSQEDIFEYYEYNAEKGDISAQLLLGQVYYTGSVTIKRDFAKAFINFRKCVQQYPSKTILNQYTDENIPADIKLKMEAASTAAGYLGLMYWRGEGLKQDNATARQWFEKGIEWNNPVSMNAMGMIYRDSGDVEKARKLFLQAAGKDNADAQVNLGEMYFEKKDYSNAIKYFTFSIRSGNLNGMYRLAEMYAFGLGTTKSCHTAIGYYKKVSEQSDHHIPYIRQAQLAYTSHDTETALLYYTLAAEIGYEIAQSNAAWIIDNQEYRENRIFNEDLPSVCVNLWNRAANQGNVDARVKMGDYYYYMKPSTSSWWNSDLNSTNYQKAASYYQVAADTQYSTLAMWNLGYLHEWGIGVDQDLHLAKRLYDQCLAMNPGAYLPVNISLFRLYLKFVLHYIRNYFSTKRTDDDDGDDALPGVHDERGRVVEDKVFDIEMGIIVGLCLVAGYLIFLRRRNEYQRVLNEEFRERVNELIGTFPQGASGDRQPDLLSDRYHTSSDTHKSSSSTSHHDTIHTPTPPYEGFVARPLDEGSSAILRRRGSSGILPGEVGEGNYLRRASREEEDDE